MSGAGVIVRGLGAVSPAGWGLAPLRQALDRAEALPARELTHPAGARRFAVRTVPPPAAPPAFLGHARLRRSSLITHYTVAAALEALGEDAARTARRDGRLGIVLCVMTGCVNYSRRFYDETLRDPLTASPLLFPETVFNAPASHLAAVLGTGAINYTLVGDPASFLQGVALGAAWLLEDRVDGCLVIGAEEHDWLTGEASQLFSQRTVLSDGAGALHLTRAENDAPGIRLAQITTPQLFWNQTSRTDAARRVRAEIAPEEAADLLCDSQQGVPRLDAAEALAWKSWPGPRLSPRRLLGEGLMAGAAWQCVAAVDALQRGRASRAVVNVTGCNHSVTAARFSAAPV